MRYAWYSYHCAVLYIYIVYSIYSIQYIQYIYSYSLRREFVQTLRCLGEVFAQKLLVHVLYRQIEIDTAGTGIGDNNSNICYISNSNESNSNNNNNM